MSDQIIADFGKFRVVGRPGENIFVQGWIGAGWKDLQSYNVISDDCAFTNAREDAEHRQKQNDRPEMQPINRFGVTLRSEGPAKRDPTLPRRPGKAQEPHT